MGKLNQRGNQNIPQHQQGSILERLKKLERFRDDVLRAMNQTFNIVDQRETQTEEVLRALIELFGREQVETKVRQLKIESLEAKALKEKVALDAAGEAGKIVATTAVTEQSVIVGSEVNKDGEQLYPTRVQLFFPQLPLDYQKCYLGAKIGDVVVTPTESKFTVKELYEVVMQPEGVSTQGPATDPAATVAVPTSGDEPADDDLAKQLVEDLTVAAETN